MSKSLKTLSFDRQNKEQNLAFIFLDKIRYKQTRFITKLVMDFIKNSGLDINNYDEVITRCESYINGDVAAVSYDLPQNNDDIKKILAIVEEIDNKIVPEVFQKKTAQIELSSQEQKNTIIETNKTPSSANNLSDELGGNFSDMLSSFRLMADK